MLNNNNYFNQLALEIKQLGYELGFTHVGISDVDLSPSAAYLKDWLSAGYQGEMGYLERNLELRLHPEKLWQETARVICCAIPYPKCKSQAIAAFAQGSDYPPTIRHLLQKYAKNIINKIKELQKTRLISHESEALAMQLHPRCFSGSAPILEKVLAMKAGLGWQAKNTILLNPNLGSYFFLGEIFINLPLPIDQPLKNRCGCCKRCINSCPTGAIIAPYQLDARRCISYLTIEYRGIIPEELRPIIGTRVFGCDQCQIVCPWNKFAGLASTFWHSYAHWQEDDLATWLLWSEEEFLRYTHNSPIRRIGYECWLRNVAVAIGNSLPTTKTLQALELCLEHPSELAREHIRYAYDYQTAMANSFPSLA